MKSLKTFVLLMFVAASANAAADKKEDPNRFRKEFCGLLNTVNVSKESDAAYVKLYNKEFPEKIITIKNQELAQSVINRISNEIQERNDKGDYEHGELKTLKMKRSGAGALTYANWYYKQSKLKYNFCVNLGSNTKRNAKSVKPVFEVDDEDFPMLGNFTPSINKSVFTPVSELVFFHDGVDMDSDEYYGDPWMTSFESPSNPGDDFCYLGQPRDFKNYLDQNEGRPYWYFDEAENYESSEVDGTDVVLTFFNDYDFSNNVSDSEVREDYFTTRAISQCPADMTSKH